MVKSALESNPAPEREEERAGMESVGRGPREDADVL